MANRKRPGRLAQTTQPATIGGGASQSGGTFRTTIADGVAAQRLDDAAASLESGQAVTL